METCCENSSLPVILENASCNASERGGGVPTHPRAHARTLCGAQKPPEHESTWVGFGARCREVHRLFCTVPVEDSGRDLWFPCRWCFAFSWQGGNGSWREGAAQELIPASSGIKPSSPGAGDSPHPAKGIFCLPGLMGACRNWDSSWCWGPASWSPGALQSFPGSPMDTTVPGPATKSWGGSELSSISCLSHRVSSPLRFLQPKCHLPANQHPQRGHQCHSLVWPWGLGHLQRS